MTIPWISSTFFTSASISVFIEVSGKSMIAFAIYRTCYETGILAREIASGPLQNTVG